MKRSADVAGQGGETDAAVAAADLIQKLDKGSYMHNGKRRRIKGDVSNFIFAENLTKLQKRLLADFRFRCKAVPGCQEDKRK